MASGKTNRSTHKNEAGREHIVHTLEPVFDKNCRVLINGSMLSPKSREYECYYGHPQNRFWKVLCGLWEESDPVAPCERHEFARSHGVALWNVIGECDIIGAADSTIQNVVANDMTKVLDNSKVIAIFNLGKEAGRLFEKLCIPPLLGDGYRCNVASTNFKRGEECDLTIVKDFTANRRKKEIYIETLPSTSPANAAWSLDDLSKRFVAIKEFAELKIGG